MHKRVRAQRQEEDGRARGLGLAARMLVCGNVCLASFISGIRGMISSGQPAAAAENSAYFLLSGALLSSFLSIISKTIA